MDTLRQDVRFAFRVLLKSPVFLAVAVLSLALGIGANTAVFTVIDSALVRQLWVQDPEELVLFNWDFDSTPPGSSHDGWMLRTPEGRRTTTSLTYPMFERFQEDGAVLSSTFAFAEMYRVSITAEGAAELSTGLLVTGGYFDGLGLQPGLGRLLAEEDDRLGAAPAAVLSHGYWQRRFGGDRGVLGQPIGINGQPFTVVGVAPAGFRGTSQVGSRPAIYVPMGQTDLISRRPGALESRRLWWIQVMGRLRPGHTVQQAESAMQVIFARTVAEEWGDSGAQPPNQPPVLRLTSGAKGLDEMRQSMASPLFIAWTVCGVVLLIACANLAGLLLARSGARRREIAVRLSMGATRLHLIRQLLTESLLLSGAGAALGLVLAFVGVEAAYGLLPAQMGSEVALDLQISPRVLGFTLLVTILTGILFGLAPAIRSSGMELTSALKDETGTTASGRRATAGRVLVVAQVALSLALLIVAGLFTRTLGNLHRIDPGFNADGLLLFRVDPRLSGYEGDELASLYGRMQDELTLLPGVRSATMSPFSLIAGRGSWTSLTPPDGPPDASVRVQIYSVAPNFLETMQIPLLAGRDLARRDGADATRVAVVNERFAREIFAGANPTGRMFGFGDTADVQVVGMSRDAKNHSLRDEILPTVYLPYLQRGRLRSMTFSLRTAGEPAALISAVRGVVRRIDPNLPLFEVKTLGDQIDETLLQERQFARLASLFGGIALALSCIGLYGLLSHAVVRRTREFGIRQALGAGRRDLTMLIMGELRLVVLGIVLGIGLSFAATRWIASMLYGLDANDPISLGAATLLLLAVATMAAYIPARRASRVDPMTALRFE